MAKLTQMFRDLAGVNTGIGRRRRVVVRESARRFFFGESDLAAWSAMAEYPTRKVRAAAERVLERGFEGVHWRAPAGGVDN